MSLACAAPVEATEVYNKLLYVLPADFEAEVRLKQGLLFLMRSELESEIPARRRLQGHALDNLFRAAQDSGTARPATMTLTRVLLEQGRTDEAYVRLRELYRGGARDHGFRRLARTVLTRMGRHREADCLSDLAGKVYGARAHCRDFRM